MTDDQLKHAAEELLDYAGNGRHVSEAQVRDVRDRLVALARQGDVAAQNLVGAIELEILNAPEDARTWFEMTAAVGDPAGQRSLGYLYTNGLGVEADLPKAVELFRTAADGGDTDAMYNLAAVNMKARGAYLSFDATLALLDAAADAGLVDAIARRGDLLAAADRDEEALDSYVQAAAQGHEGAMNAAACWYRDGTAGDPDPVQALRWFLALYHAGNGDGFHEAHLIADAMSAEQIREAARLVGHPIDAEALIFTVD